MLDGSVVGELTITAEGQSDASLRGIFVRHYKADWKKLVEEELLKVFPLIQFQEVKYPENPYDYSDPIVMSFKYTIPDFAVITAEEILFTPVVASNLFKRAQGHLYFGTDLEERKNAFKDGCSRMIELNETIKLPTYSEVLFMPEAESSKGTGADFHGGYTIDAQILTLSETASFKKRVYEPEDWESFRAAVKLQNKFADEKIILKLK